jgi:hypothetical protein
MLPRIRIANSRDINKGAFTVTIAKVLFRWVKRRWDKRRKKMLIRLDMEIVPLAEKASCPNLHDDRESVL